ncbi:MAG: macrocin O-methyltransferase [Caldilineae bacterium]|nr:MAG: macrocin O-methyltransferase [Caldilineae bacterium]
MKRWQLTKTIKEQFATSGLKPSARLEVLNLLLELGQWLKKHKVDVSFQTRNELYDYLNRQIIGNSQPIDYLEFGVWYGRSIAYWSSINRHPDSRFFGFDTFEGLPENWRTFTTVLPSGTFSAKGKLPDVEDSRVSFVKGLFQETLPAFLADFQPAHRLVVNCDADLYTSTLFVLATLNPVLIPGSIVIFDEFSTVHEFRAFRDFTQSFMRRYRVLASADRFYLRMALEFLV